MKDERVVMVLSVFFAALLWMFIPLLDSMVSPRGSVLDFIAFRVPLEGFLNGGIAFVTLVAFGFVAARTIVRSKRNGDGDLTESGIARHQGAAMLKIDSAGIIRGWNRESEEVFGYTTGEMIGTSVSRLFPPESPLKPMDLLDTIVKGDCENRHELPLIGKDGRKVVVFASFCTLKDSAEPGNAWIILTDITAVRENERKLETMRREQERFMRHELKNALVPIRGYAELLQVAVPEGMTPTQQLYLKRILEGTKRAINLIDSLKKLQNIESGAYELERVEFPLETILRDAVGDLSQMADRNEVVIDCTCSFEEMSGLFDLNLMPGVFHNLIKNAIEHVSGCENPEERKLRVELTREGSSAVVKINNRGIPLAPERIATFFEKFNTDRKRKSSGTGLGTTYAYLVTRAHGGTISVTSNEADGTTVTVRLELLDSAS
jgi:PAS domain S-box-containing protein